VSGNGIIEEAEDWIEDAVGEVEHVLKPRPGGKIDTARRMAEQHSQKDLPVADTDTLIKGKPVAVDELLPENGLAGMVVLNAANPVLPLLPRDTTRRAAVLLAVDNDVYVSSSPSVAAAAAASGGTAFTGCSYLPAGIPVPWPSTAPLWCAPTTTATDSRITVMTAYKGA
jgi:hypothetical protein